MKDAELTAEERLAELFQPDVLLPTQFFDRLRRRSEHDGERRLMVAVLEDAVEVYRKKCSASTRTISVAGCGNGRPAWPADGGGSCRFALPSTSRRCAA